MKRLLRYVKKEWEQAVCVITALLCALVLLSWFLGAASGSPARDSRPLPEHESVFGDRAFAFLNESPGQDSPGRNPFRFEVRQSSGPESEPKPEPEPRPATPRDSEAPRKPPEPEGETTPEPSDDPRPQPSPRPSPQPEYRLVPCDVTFVFYNVNASGKPLALLELRNPARESATPLAKTLGAGETLLGMKVVKVEADALYLIDAAGRRHQIGLGEQQRTAIRVKPP